MAQLTTHNAELPYLRKIEGQVRGIQKMIQDKRYCVDILTQLHSVVGAILRVEDNVLKKHLEGCVSHALRGKSDIEKNKKLDEVISLLKRFRRGA